MHPIQIPEDWPDAGRLTVEEFCDLIRTPPRNAPCVTGANAASAPAGPASTAAAGSTSLSPRPAASCAMPRRRGMTAGPRIE